MPFELFKGAEVKNLQPEIHIRPSRQISFNHDAVLAMKLDSFKYAQLYYDSAAGKIGILPTNDDSVEGKIELSICLKSRSGWIAARAFFDHYGLDIPTGKAVPVDFTTNDSGMIILDYPGG